MTATLLTGTKAPAEIGGGGVCGFVCVAGACGFGWAPGPCAKAVDKAIAMKANATIKRFLFMIDYSKRPQAEDAETRAIAAPPHPDSRTAQNRKLLRRRHRCGGRV